MFTVNNIPLLATKSLSEISKHFMFTVNIETETGKTKLL